MNSFLKDFYRDERGAMAAIIVLGLFVLLGFGALAIDMSFAGSTRTELQVAASSAAMAGVQNINEGDPTNSDYRVAAVEFTYRNMGGAGNGNLVEAGCGTYNGSTVTSSTECSDVKVGNWAPATIPGDRGIFTAHESLGVGMDLDAVRVFAHRSQERGNPLNLFLAPVVGVAQQDVTVAAVAWAEPTTISNCIIALEPTEDKAFHAQGTAYLDADDCGICVNSTSPEGFYLNGTPVVDIGSGEISINSDGYRAKGNYSLPEENIKLADPVGSQECKDPFENNYSFEELYTDTTCTSTEQLHLTSGDLVDGVFKIPGGTYCGGIKIASNGPVEFGPGPIHIKDGTLDFVGNHDMSGDDITFVCDNCVLDFRGGQDVNFNAGAYDPAILGPSPFLVYEKYPPSSTASYPDETHFFHGDADADYEGIMYVPYRDTEWTGNNVAGLNPPVCFAVIAKTFHFSGTSDIHVSAAGCGGLLDQIAVTYRLVD